MEHGSGNDGRGQAAVLFDVDGTLVDSAYIHALTWWEAFRQYGYTVSTALAHRSVGMGGEELLDHVLGEDRDADESAAISAAHKALAARFWPSLAAFSGAGDLVRTCAARGWSTVLATSASAREAKVLRRVLEVDDVLTAMTDADDVERAKPAPDLVSVALAKAGADAERSIMVGDAVWDVLAAERAGVRCIGVLSGGFSRQELLDAGALEVHEDPAALLAALDRSVLGSPDRLLNGWSYPADTGSVR
ncbi:HAD family hydrolase [Actinospica sp. MGRD01-02]|uniref:HAD family hydrolase n=1 Tax=Actinospica acidithermotolerans TaxID=2828514 RepID=A0A941IN36_9ACTN|nr:HAD family hydrolase [Actinospica acidithermotolerans]MBR7829121.1 HAD family hydrolase [Actinospica acidithermotolerans]